MHTATVCLTGAAAVATTNKLFNSFKIRIIRDVSENCNNYKCLSLSSDDISTIVIPKK